MASASYPCHEVVLSGALGVVLSEVLSEVLVGVLAGVLYLPSSHAEVLEASRSVTAYD